LWAIHAAVFEMLRAALTPRRFTLADLTRTKQAAWRLLGEAKRKRQRQRLLSAKSLT
jgi:hypothetical protein